MVLAAGWALATGQELLAGGLEAKLTWFKLRFLFVPFVPPVALALVQSVIGGPRWLGRKMWAVLLAVPVLSLPLALTTDQHRLFRRDFRIELVGGLEILRERMGPFGALQATVGFGISLLGAVIVVQALRRAAPVARKQVALMLWTCLLPLPFYLAYNLGVGPLPGVNLAPAFLGVTAGGWVWALFRYGTLTLVPNAHAVVVENLPWAVLVLDSAGRLAGANRTAAAKIGLELPRAIGEPAREVIAEPWKGLLPPFPVVKEEGTRPFPLEDGGRVAWYERVVTPLNSRSGEPVGAILVIRDVTEQVRLETLARETLRSEADRLHARQLELLVRDLHDGIGGITANIALMAALGQKDGGPEGKDGILRRIDQLATEGSSQVRGLMNSLEARDRTWQDLAVEMRRHGTMFLEEHGIALTLDLRGGPPPAGPGLYPGVSFFNLYREALNNVVKHASAGRVDVALCFGGDGLTLTIRDDGRGLPEPLREGRGLSNMRQRARELGGELRVQSDPGVTLELSLPIPLAPRTP
jgi:PAS domain S-box-containing protein